MMIQTSSTSQVSSLATPPYQRRCGYRSRAWLALPGLLFALGVAALPQEVEASVEHEVCLRWRVDAIDLRAGTLLETDQMHWAARGVRVRISHANGGGWITTGRANTSDGCFSFFVFGLPGDPLPNTVYRDIRVYYDTRVGTPASGQTHGRVHVRGYYLQSEEQADTDVSILIQNVGFQLQPDQTYKATVNVGSGVAPMSISMASVAHTLHRVDTAMTANKPAAPPLLRVILQDCNYGVDTGNWSCLLPPTPTGLGRLFLSPTNTSTERIFVSGHEAGHWLDYHWGGTPGMASASGANYSFASGNQQSLAQTCRFTWTDLPGTQGQYAHAMRSQEYQRGAVTEAFAHFMALYAYNNVNDWQDPEFQYYKTQTPGLVDGDYPAEDHYYGVATTTSEAIATPYAFVRASAGCNCASLGNCSRTSTQMQWMRAYWWYLIREPGTPKPTLTQLFGQMQSSNKSTGGVSCGPSVDRCYGAISAAIPPTFLPRWESVGTKMYLGTDQPL